MIVLCDDDYFERHEYLSQKAVENEKAIFVRDERCVVVAYKRRRHQEAVLLGSSHNTEDTMSNACSATMWLYVRSTTAELPKDAANVPNLRTQYPKDQDSTPAYSD